MKVTIRNRKDGQFGIFIGFRRVHVTDSFGFAKYLANLLEECERRVS